MVRFMTGDCYPFLESVRFGIESGEDNRANYLEHSGAVLYYGQDEASERENGFTCADGTPVTLTSYFEGDDDETPVTLTGRYPRTGCAFRMDVPLSLIHIQQKRHRHMPPLNASCPYTSCCPTENRRHGAARNI